MIKLTSNNDFDFDVESVVILNDSKQLTKRASARDLLKYDKTKGQTDLHVIAVGAYEGTGQNRNGDRFSEPDCKNNHHYFKDSGRAIHRHHKNKKHDPKYGVIKASAYNDPMKRIELVIGLDNDKCADILDEQEKTGNTNWSMACKVAHDVCTFCHHKAKSDKDRCEHIPSLIGELNKKGEMCGMENPNPKWFELSHVRRPADRIGMSLRKLASYDGMKPMLPTDYLKLYPGFEVPEDELLISKRASAKRELLNKLSAMEKHMQANSSSKITQAKKLSQSESVDAKTIDELRKHDPAKVLKILADHGIVFSPGDFISYFFGDRVDSKGVSGMKKCLPGLFSNINDDDEDRVRTVNDEKFDPGPLGSLPAMIKRMIGGLEEGHSIKEGPAVRRIMRITMIMSPKAKAEVKDNSKEASEFDRELAKAYGSYKLAALNYMQENGLLNDTVIMNAVAQDYE